MKFIIERYLILIFILSNNTLTLTKSFVSRWEFQSIANFVYDTTNDWVSAHPPAFEPSKVKKNSIVFVRSECLGNFFKSIHPFIPQKYILLTHVDDYAIPGGFISYLNDPKIIHWFAINPSIVDHHKFTKIPIGYWQIKVDQPFTNLLFEDLRKLNNRPHMLYLNFGLWSNPERTFVKNLFINKPFCYVAENKPYFEYLKEMAKCKFVLSPPGNGLDCHRTWEALMVGSIPIVKSSNLNSLFEGLPVLIITDWNVVNQKYLEKKYSEMKNKKYNYDKLYIEYWKNLMKSKMLKR